jgi:hypothetical protein
VQDLRKAGTSCLCALGAGYTYDYAKQFAVILYQLGIIGDVSGPILGEEVNLAACLRRLPKILRSSELMSILPSILLRRQPIHNTQRQSNAVDFISRE